MKDSWCKPLFYQGKLIHGAVARGVRIKQAGGVEKLLHDVALKAATDAAQHVYDVVTMSANLAHSGKLIQMPTQRKAA